MQCGVDISKIDRFEKFLNDDKFIKKYFTANEVEYINSKRNKVQTLAGLFSAKEAFLKALGIGIGAGLDLLDICISHNNQGMPQIEITPKIQYYISKIGANDVSVSISHDGDYAIAFCTVA